MEKVASQRASKVVYDRAGSSIALAKRGDIAGEDPVIAGVEHGHVVTGDADDTDAALPAQPPQNIIRIRIHLQYSGQSVKSTVPKPVVLMSVAVLKKAWRRAVPQLP